MSFNQSMTRFLKLSLLFIFIGYYSSITLFYHVHIVNGQAIAHSHFFKSDSDNKTPFAKHSHPISTYDLIFQLNKINSEELTVISPYEQPFFLSHSIIRGLIAPDTFKSIHLSEASRAPPVC